jgi:hypothetical protein
VIDLFIFKTGFIEISSLSMHMQLNFIAVKTQMALDYASKIALLILRNN